MNQDEKQRRLFRLLIQSPHQTTPEEVNEIRRIEKELEDPEQPGQLPTSNTHTGIMKDMSDSITACPAIRKALPKLQNKSTVLPSAVQSIRKVSDKTEWSNLVHYYAECLERENRQQYLIDTYLLWTFDCETDQVCRFMHGESVFEFDVVRGQRSNSITQFLDAQKDKSDRKLCLGFPFLVFEAPKNESLVLKAAPLLFTPITFSETDERFTLKSDGYEISYAALKALHLDDEEISEFLSEIENISPTAEQDLLEIIESKLLGKIHDAYQEILPRVTESFSPLTIYTKPALFWVSENIATLNLIRELKQLGESYYYERSQQALKQLLATTPDHDYPSAPSRENDNNIYVTAINNEQRRAIEAAKTEPIVVVTGPPGTGKSQLVLNLITQAFLNGQTVLFASRNNRAVDVVMNRLKEEIHFQGAVRTGNTENRKLAAADMKNSLNEISAAIQPVNMDRLRKMYERATQRAHQAEKQLSEVRRTAGLATSHSEERDRLIKLLPNSLKKTACEHLPPFRGLEIQSLTATTVALHSRALKQKGGKTYLLEAYRTLVVHNSTDNDLIRHLQGFENEWGTFAGGFLHRENFERLSEMDQHITNWQNLIHAFDLLYRQAEIKQLCRRLSTEASEALRDLTSEQAENAEILANEYSAALLGEVEVQFLALGKRLSQLALEKQSWWKQLWMRLLRQVPLKQEMEQYIAYHAHLGLEPHSKPREITPHELASAAQEYGSTCLSMTKVLKAAGKQYSLNDATREAEQIGQAVDSSVAQLPVPIQQDIMRLVPISVDQQSLLHELASLLDRNEAIRDELAELAEAANQKLCKNSDQLEMLAEFSKSVETSSEICPFDPQSEIETLLQQLAVWRNLIAFWETETKLRGLEEQLSSMPTDPQAVQEVQQASSALLAAGGEILRKTWDIRSRQLPAAVVQGALDYIQAVEQLSQGINPALYKQLKQAEEDNLPCAVQVFPVWATTNLAARTNFPLEAGFFDLLIIDEASQCDVPSALPLLYRANRIIVIGDPNQLRHVATLTKDSDQEVADKYSVALEAFSYNGHSMFDLSHRAVGSHPGYIFLKEHYRSDPRIINFSNQLFYNNQLVVRTDFSLRSISMDFIQAHGGMHWLQVKGRAEHPKGGSAYNQAEIAAIQTLVPRLIESLQRRQLSDASIGIVSPYREQEERIQSWVRETYGDTRRITVGTAHKFQGDEKDIMIFSTVLGPGLKEGSLHWLQTTRNLLNVAVTRARISLIMIGDWEYCHELPVDHCFRILADYVARESKRVVAEVKELSLVTAPEIKIVGVVVGPVDREYARITLRRFISSCFDYVWWTDPYFDTRVTDLFWDVFQDQDIKIKEIRLLTSEETLVSNDGYPPKLDVNRYTTLQADLASRGIRIELRCLPSRQMPHDRLFYAPGQAINMPPFDNAYGIHSRLSEYTRSSTNPDTFMKYWNEAKQV